MQMIRSGDNRKTQLLSQLDQKIFFSVVTNTIATRAHLIFSKVYRRQKQLLKIIVTSFFSVDSLFIMYNFAFIKLH